MTLDYTVEPQSEGDPSGNALDPDSNVTIDFGIFFGSELYAIPTLGEWGMLMLMLLMVGVGVRRLRP